MRSHFLTQSRRACPELVERGRLSLAQHAVLGKLDEHDPVPAGTAENHPKTPSGVSNPAKFRTVVILSVVPSGLFDLRRRPRTAVLGYAQSSLRD